MADKINKEEFSEKLEELAKKNKNKKRSMLQLLELTKRFYVTKKQEKIQKQLEDVSKKQEELSKKSSVENKKEAQEKLNKEFKDIQKEIDELISENRKLRKPEDIERDKPTEESIKVDQKEFLAIRCHDGVFDKANEAYFFSNVESSRQKSSIISILHTADFLASKVEYDIWKAAGGSTTSKVKKTSASTGRKVNYSEGLSKMLKNL